METINWGKVQDEAHEVSLTVEEARALLDEIENEDLLNAIDLAQATPFSGDGPGYVVIKIG